MIYRFTALFLIVSTFVSCTMQADKPTSFVRADALHAAIENQTFKEITSVLVSQNGTLIYEQYWGDGAIDYLNDTRSATKSLTAMAVGAAIMDGHIESVNDPAFVLFEAERPFRRTCRTCR